MKTLYSYFSAKPKQTPKKSHPTRMEEEVTPETKSSEKRRSEKVDASSCKKTNKPMILEKAEKAAQRSSPIQEKKSQKRTPNPKSNATPSPKDSAKRGTRSSGRKRKVISYQEDDDEYCDDDEEEAYEPADEPREEEFEQEDEIDEEDESSDDEPVSKKRKTRSGPKGSNSKRAKHQEEAGSQEDEKPNAIPESEAFKNPEAVQLSREQSKALKRAKAAAGQINDSSDEKMTGYKSWDFLDPKKRRDKNGKRPGEEGYDSNTILIDPSYYKKMTPAERQYWQFKCQNMDFILFFKMGKFYELFDDDADVGARELGFNYMGGKRRHTGFPEKAFDRYAADLVRLGYKVARVEQTETPQQLAERNAERRKKRLPKDSVVRREMIQVLTPGTASEERFIGSQDANYTIAIHEEKDLVGVSFVDTSRLRLYVGQFSDDQFRSRLRTLLFQLNPTEVILPRDQLSKRTELIVRTDLKANTKRNILAPGSEFYDAETTWDKIEAGGYFKDGLPEVLKMIRAKKEDAAATSLGGLLYYLRKVMIDREQLSAGTFNYYSTSDPKYANSMILDAQTLENLEILRNDQGKVDGTLLSHIDRTVTPFGRRLIKEWIMRPLIKLSDINARLEAVEELMSRQDDLRELSGKLKKLPDLERLLVRIHANSLPTDKKAVFYENVNAKKIEQFLSVLKGFHDCERAIKGIEDEFESETLSHITTIGKGFPDIGASLDFFDSAFNKSEAREKGYIIPNKGVNKEYDEIERKIADCEKKLQKYLHRQQAMFDDRNIKFKHMGKEKYQLEVSIETLKKKAKSLPSNWMLSGSTKKTKRYLTPECRQLAEELSQAEFDRETILKDVSRAMFARFCEKYKLWSGVVSCLAELDCLMSLAVVSVNQSPSTKPIFEKQDKSFIEIRDAIHPTVASSQNVSNTAFIPNDIVIGAAENEAKFLLVSGPNMGGKSTLLRQSCVTVILAQIGCYVPAEHCKLAPVDRIFTRVGANDRIMQGQSTFMVELQETGNILKHATPRSLVILDELGRGTSTFDGTAIAYSVINYLLKEKKCMTLFSTHYHKLLDEFKNDKAVAMYHMACRVEKEAVTFLYKFTKGTCKNSYGMNCASLAGLPKSVVERAKSMAKNFEEALAIAHGQNHHSGLMKQILKNSGDAQILKKLIDLAASQK
mmetsp:Transcript_2807/g.6532  ORF Transcript_2807/g.6532 Transcript_2807/m.6532 type:complete len:1165 (-) Transcript_2807:166-3660(-)